MCMFNPVEGEIFCIDKPLGWSSFDAVKKIRGRLLRRLHTKKLKVGHAGTLDPLATGVLIICTGHATKRIDELQTGVKEYIADMMLGATTPSFDRETEVDATYPWQHITREMVEQTLQSRFVGRIEQVPPAYSACNVDGHRAYKIARKGREVKLKAKVLEINEIELLDFNPPTMRIRVVCGRGTYIRALARDIGEALSSGAYLTGLRRTRVGDFKVDDCRSVEDMASYIDDAPMVIPDTENA